MSSNGSNGPDAVPMAAKAVPAMIAAGIVTVLIVLGLSRAGCVNVVTPPGHEGYIKSKPIFGSAEFVGIQKGPTSTGWVWRQEVENIDMRPRTYTVEMRIPTQDRLEVALRAHALIQLRKGSVKDVVEKFGGASWYRANVEARFRSAVRAEVQKLDAFSVKDRMSEIGNAVLAKMRQEYAEDPVEFMSVDIGNIQYPQAVVDRVIDKFVTNERNEQKDIELDIAQRQIDIGVAEAQGVADAQMIIRTTLDPMFLQYEALKAVEELANSANTTFLVVPYSEAGSAPIIMSLDK